LRGAIAAVLVAVLVGGVLFRFGDGAHALAAETLRSAARIAEGQPSRKTASADVYSYTKVKGASLVTVADGIGFSALVPVVIETWVALDGSGRRVSSTGLPVFLGRGDRDKWQAAGRPSLGEAGTSDVSYGPGKLSDAEVEALPTDPERLFEVIKERAAATDAPASAEMLVVVADLLSRPSAAPELRAALYRVAAEIPGIELIGRVTDPVGRQGIAVASTSDYSWTLSRRELIFSPNDARILAEREVLLEHVPWLDADPPMTISYSVYLESGFAASTSERPSCDSQLDC
jgi:hypothetical protein